jgi:hypothetical protein
MKNLYLAAIDEVRAERDEYLATLTEAERTAYLKQLLSETDPPRALNTENDFVRSLAFTDAEGLPPDEQSVEIEDASVLATRIRFAGGNHVNSPNWRSRCGCDQTGPCTTLKHGTSYVAVDYNYGIGRGAFDIVVYIRHYGRDYFGNRPWDQFVNCAAAYKLWRSGRLTGPGSPGREGYFSSGNNQTAGDHKGTLGVAAYLPGTDTMAWNCRWYFDGPGDGWGAEWLHCGKDYNIWLADA